MKTRYKENKPDKDILLKIVEEISRFRKKDITEDEVSKIIRRNTPVRNSSFSKSEILRIYKKLKNVIKISKDKEKKFLDAIRMKKVRTISGVTPVAVLTKPYPCPGNCIYCPNDPDMPKSYLSKEPGAQRASSNGFDPYLQVFSRLLAYKNIGHPTDKVELIVLGGTWSFYNEEYQIWFIKRCFDAMNDFDHDLKHYRKENKADTGKIVSEEKGIRWEDLYKSQEKNEKATSRCVGLVLETRPDYITEDEVLRLRKLGCTKVQIGVQSLNDGVLLKNKRGHGVKETSKAFETLRLAGFKIHAHWMPNLLGSNPKEDLIDFKKLFSDKRFRPDEIKIYPCSLIYNTELYEYFKKGKWKPYSEEELIYVLKNCLILTPRYCRVSRMVRDISSDDIVVGNKKSNLRQDVEKKIINEGNKIEEIRFREVKGEKINVKDLIYKEKRYETLVSTEYFLEYVTKKDKIAAFLRLSLPKKKSFIKEIDDSAMIREIHVYGRSVEIGKEEKFLSQHTGLGKKLIKEAIAIAKTNGFKKLSVISSIGTRQYYLKNGFEKGTLYQTKKIK